MNTDLLPYEIRFNAYLLDIDISKRADYKKIKIRICNAVDDYFNTAEEDEKKHRSVYMRLYRMSKKVKHSVDALIDYGIVYG